MNNLITHAVVLAVSSAKLCDSYFCKFLIARRRRRGFASAGLFMLLCPHIILAGNIPFMHHIHIGQASQYLSDCVSTASVAGDR